MKKNNFIKTFMQVFAILASIGGILFLCKDKIKACPCFSKGGCLTSLKEKFTRKPEVADKMKDTDDESDEDDDDSFLHAFDVDPASEREYVSLTINSSTKAEAAAEAAMEATTEAATETELETV